MSSKIILFNLNRYVGGGETILVRYAEYLKRNNVDYSILCAFESSWIESNVRAKKLNHIRWPLKNDSLIYFPDKILHVRSYLESKLKSDTVINLFTFCMRDYVNSVLVFRESRLKINLFHGLYHPQDYEYLSSLSFDKSTYHKYFQSVIYDLYLKSSILFLNSRTAEEAVGDNLIDHQPIVRCIPINQEIDITYSGKFPPNKNIVCISRFVSFKVGSIVAFLRLARLDPEVKCTLIGHGPYEWLIKLLVRLWSIKNLTIYTEVGPDDLHTLVLENDIGYAQGTSILEIAKYGIPVIIAPYSKLDDVFNKNFSTFGIFGFVEDRLELGDLYAFQGAPKFSLAETVQEISNNYLKYQLGTIESVKKFEATHIFGKITEDILNSSSPVKQLLPIQVKPPLVKRVIRYALDKFY
jgi:hypothetical protein